MVLIAVHGTASRSVPAELGTVHLDVVLEGDDRAAVLAAVTGVHERLVADAEAAVAAGTATRWWSAQVLARPERRYAPDGTTHRTVQVVSADVRVEFRDLGALTSWAASAAADGAVTVGGIRWALSNATAERLQREVRVAAVQDATARAEAYAGAIGAPAVVLQALWEAGLRPAGGGERTGSLPHRMARLHDAGLDLRPDDIEVAAEVSADFLVA